MYKAKNPQTKNSPSSISAPIISPTLTSSAPFHNIQPKRWSWVYSISEVRRLRHSSEYSKLLESDRQIVLAFRSSCNIQRAADLTSHRLSVYASVCVKLLTRVAQVITVTCTLCTDLWSCMCRPTDHLWSQTKTLCVTYAVSYTHLTLPTIYSV